LSNVRTILTYSSLILKQTALLK